jgi:hypothetical protein
MTTKTKRKYTWKIDDATRKSLAVVRVKQLQEGVAKWRQEQAKHPDRIDVTRDELAALTKVLSTEKLLALRLHVTDTESE